MSSKKKTNFLLGIICYGLQAILIISFSRDVTLSIIALIFPILCIIGYILQQKKIKKPPSQEIPYKPE